MNLSLIEVPITALIGIIIIEILSISAEFFSLLTETTRGSIFSSKNLLFINYQNRKIRVCDYRSVIDAKLASCQRNRVILLFQKARNVSYQHA